MVITLTGFVVIKLRDKFDPMSETSEKKPLILKFYTGSEDLVQLVQALRHLYVHPQEYPHGNWLLQELFLYCNLSWLLL